MFVWVLILFSGQKQGTPPRILIFMKMIQPQWLWWKTLQNIMQDDLPCYLPQQPYSKSYNCGIADGNVLKRVIFQVLHHRTPVTNKAMFHNIHTLLCIIYTLPVTSCEYKQLVCCAALFEFYYGWRKND